MINGVFAANIIKTVPITSGSYKRRGILYYYNADYLERVSLFYGVEGKKSRM